MRLDICPVSVPSTIGHVLRWVHVQFGRRRRIGANPHAGPRLTTTMAPRQRDHMIPAYFRRTNDGFEPLELARSDWNWDHLHGVAVSGLLACGAENALRGLDREHFVPARFHADLSRPTRAAFTTVVAEVVRSSGRLTQVDVSLHQSGNVAARGSALFLR